MVMTRVQSSNVESVGYDPLTNTLRVAFNNGGLYEYHGVPETIYRGLVSASSVGSYLASSVKGTYAYTKLR